VIKERPVNRASASTSGRASNKINVWNDLGWDNVQPGAAGSYVLIDNAMSAFQSQRRRRLTTR